MDYTWLWVALAAVAWPMIREGIRERNEIIWNRASFEARILYLTKHETLEAVADAVDKVSSTHPSPALDMLYTELNQGARDALSDAETALSDLPPKPELKPLTWKWWLMVVVVVAVTFVVGNL